ncbi:transporter substrate-binding domain-containing protein [Endozoicomonas sp. SM1973]|uniref:Transporter substrate-binding domain-containing protein n=1 Tax=Spartinivicinus marinus TaxID=2994442 RepID=A0A853IJB8_9GAMM|nr:transporter substrate-binding domain-containing protein [Spartinivicinus marinus]MCX4029126.1 transporter substrate-binding domain-containing protein [Spartinivicinus marinus]NYZ67746.1 transporter substrate-binding domain-containing protein [Spartinivicinus marinus]
MMFKPYIYTITLWLLSTQSFAEKTAITTINLTNGEWPPYLGQLLPHHGFASHIVSKAFSSVGIKVHYSFFPWPRAYHYALAGTGINQTWHGTLVWVYTSDRANHFIYSDPVVKDEEVLFHLKNTPLQGWQHVDDLKGQVIGGTRHTAYPFFENAEQKGILRLERAGNYFDLFNRLLGKRIDAIPQVKQVGQYYLRTQYTPQQNALITSAPKVIQTREYSLMINKKLPGNKQLIKQFNKGLKIIKQNGTYSRLYEQLTSGFYDTQRQSN